jgi:hypothetical protein
MIVHLIWGVGKALDQGELLQGSHGNRRQEISVHQLPGLVPFSTPVNCSHLDVDFKELKRGLNIQNFTII